MKPKNEMTIPTWEQMCKDKSGTIYRDWFEDGLRCLVMRGPGALCAYVGVPLDHPLAGRSYEDIPVRVHYGLTFSGEGDGKWRPKGSYWYGWDYYHCDDYSFYYDTSPSSVLRHTEYKKWMVNEVEAEIQDALYEFKKLMKLVEVKQ
jgi:hypothetical protein